MPRQASRYKSWEARGTSVTQFQEMTTASVNRMARPEEMKELGA